MAMKGYFAFPKAPVLLEPHFWLFSVISGHSLGGSYLSAEVQSVYSTAPADWAKKSLSFKLWSTPNGVLELVYKHVRTICCLFLSSWQSSHVSILAFFLLVTAWYLVVCKPLVYVNRTLHLSTCYHSANIGVVYAQKYTLCLCLYMHAYTHTAALLAGTVE